VQGCTVLVGVLLIATWLAPPEATGQDSLAVDSTLIKELERELGAIAQVPQTRRARPSLVARSGQTTNPDISVVGDFRSRYDSGEERSFDMEMHEVETALRGAIDPYARADVFIAIANEDGEFVFELEEAFLTTFSLPWKLQARLGKFRSNFGKLNRIHPHALPYPDVPAIYERYFGLEGLNDEGVSVSWLLPNRSFYQEFTFEFTRGPTENPSYERSEDDRFLYLGRLKNFWDLTRNATLELGLSGTAGPNDVGATTTIGGVDLTYIWKPLRRNRYRSIVLQVEGLVSNRRSNRGADVTSFGFYALIQYQLSQRLHFIARYDHSDLPDDNGWNENAVGGFLAWYATEFQKLELGLKTSSGARFNRKWEVLARLIFVIGTHGSHEY